MSDASPQSMTGAAAIPGGPYHSLVVAKVIRETHDSCSLVLDVPDALREAFHYHAGQFLTFRLAVGGKRLVRCYSLASSPDTDSEYKVTIKRIADGRVSNHVNDAVEVGQSLEVMKPAGHFCLQERGDPILLFSGGSGITPVVSIIKTALATSARSLRLLYANRDRDSIIFRDEIDRLARESGDRLTVEHSLDDQSGFVDVPQVQSFVGDLRAADFYVCGPGPFMDVVEVALQGLSVEPGRIFIERFESPDDPVEVEPVAAADAAGGARVTIHLDGQISEIVVAPGETILHAARRAGLEPPFACEEAYCGCCMAHVKEGVVDMKMNDGGIDDSQRAEGWVLTCQGLPKSPSCTIEYPD